MSVCACDRAGCEEIMCTRLILNGSRYVCSSCWRELLDFKDTWPADMTKKDVEDKVRAFMSTVPETFSLPKFVDVDDAFDKLCGSNQYSED